MFYNIIEEFSDIIASYSIIEYKKYGAASSLVAKIQFKDGSSLSIRDYLFLNGKRKYSYHWQNAEGKLISRWDSSPHHQKISTFPHHKHLPDGVVDSKEISFKDVLKSIRTALQEKAFS